ncbi:MAG: response regulator [Owenweeksia sp.]|nr:response regulator [Owenweeksia sp.]
MTNYTLVVDDDAILLFLMKKLISKTNFAEQAGFFDGGAKALDFIKDNYRPGKAHFTIFLDINMPEMNGWEFLEALAAFASPEHISVIIITSSTDQEDQNRAHGNTFVRDFLIKPVKAEDLEHVEQLLS